MKDLTIELLTVEDSADLSLMLNSNSPQYQQYFIPFSFEQSAIAEMISKAKEDRYWGVWKNEKLIAFFMLRGFDEGYDIPAYGVCVAESHAGKGVLKLSLQFAFTWCRFYGVSKVMLKVHPENHAAKRTYEKFGFEYSGIDPKNKNLIYHCTL